jgi:hypothetical protein
MAHSVYITYLNAFHPSSSCERASKAAGAAPHPLLTLYSNPYLNHAVVHQLPALQAPSQQASTP